MWIRIGMVVVFGLAWSHAVVATPEPPASAPAPAATRPSAGAEAAAVAAQSDPDPWPRVMESAKFTLKVYPPQVDAWDGTILEAHSAVAVLPKGTESPLYGVVEFRARTRVDRESRLVVVDQFQSVNATFPSHPDKTPQLLGFLQKKLNDAVRVIALDRLETAVAAGGAEASAPELAVKNDPPKIVFAEGPSMLVGVDGAPVWRPVEGTSFERLLNTRPLILRTAGTHYLHLFDGWLAAPALAGPWKPAPAAPAGIDAAQRKALAEQSADLLAGGDDAKTSEVGEDGKPLPRPTLAKGPVPEIVVTTEPTELVVFEGAPKWTAIPDTGLEFVANTSGNVFRLGGTHYVLLAGRWFSAPALAGPWTHVAQSKLAEDFRRIPDDSPKENVKASVAGTAQAQEAVIANSVAQTSEVKRAEAKFKPTLDGEPKWDRIEGTALQYVVNSATPIVRVDPSHLYAVYNGVWFTAPVLAGPWITAAEVPAAIYSIPPSSPLHYVTYVKVYNATKDVVVVGYTPGYYGTVVSDSVVVYGTGYTYSPWVGSYWYGSPWTYGYAYGITYTPWNGWAFAVGVGWAWGYWGGWYGPYYPPYWGPYYGYGYGYYGGVAVGAGGGMVAWGPGGWAGTTGNIYRQWGSVSSVSRYSGGYNAWTGTAWRGQVGAAYNSRTGTLAAGQRGAVANIYSGRYAYGSRGVATNTRTGNTVAGGRVTMGDADTGRQVTAGRVGGYNPNTGESGSAGWVRGENGGVARVGDDFYAGKDGNVYRRGDNGWESVGAGGEWNGVGDSARSRDLDRQSYARSSGQQRYNSYRASVPRSRPSGGGFRRR